MSKASSNIHIFISISQQSLLFTILFLLNHPSFGQERKGFEVYHYAASPGLLSSMSAKLFYQDKNSWYTEIRYNYEEEQTMAFSVGKAFHKDKLLSYSFTPLLGFSVGKLQGVSAGLNTSLSYRSFEFCSFLQYSSRLETGKNDYIFSWSEFGYQATKFLYTGIALQQTCFYPATNNWEPGIQLAFCFKNWVFPLYFFKASADGGYLMAGIFHEWKN
jgi:hypothetical protein